MIKTRRTLLTLVTALTTAGACQATSDERGGDAGRAGTPNGGSGTGASAGAAGEAAETNDAGNAGEPSAAGTGEPGASGATDGGASNAAGSGGEAGADADADAGAAGERGTPGAARPEYAYLTTFLGGIFAFSFDSLTGSPERLPGLPVDTAAQIYAASVDPSQRRLYVLDLLHELDEFAINRDGTLPMTPASSTPIQGSPVTLALDPKGRFAYVGTRTDEPKTSIEPFKIDPLTGALSSAGDALELDGAPAYVAVDPAGHFAYVTESTSVGIWGYSIDQTTGLLSPVDPLPFGDDAVFAGAIAFRPDGEFLYTAGNGLNAFAIDSVDGTLERVQGSPFNTEVSSDPSATNIAIEPRGKFLYATQFVGGSHLFGFSIDDESGKLTPVSGGAINANMPYSLGVEPFGRFLFVAGDDGKLFIFALNQTDGTLREIDASPFDLGGLQPELAFARPFSH